MLFDLAERWPALETFSVPYFSVAGLPPPEAITERALGPPSSHPLRKLELGRIDGELTETTMLQLALLLDALFPQLGRLEPEPSSTETEVDSWLGY